MVSSWSKPWLQKEHLFRPDWINGPQRTDSKIWLDKNECLDPVLHEVVQQALSRVIEKKKGFFSYPETTSLYKKLGAFYEISPNCIRLTAGSDGAIRAAFEAFVNSGDTVLHTSPTFAMYSIYCKMFNAHEITCEYVLKNESEIIFQSQKFLELIVSHKPRLVCLPNPDSPTGTVVGKAFVHEVIRLTKENGGYVLVDEAYFPFFSETCIRDIEKFDNLIVARTFAKAWGMAGLRIGFAAACKPVTEMLHQVRPMYEVNTFACYALEEMLEEYKHVEKSVAKTVEVKEKFESELKLFGFSILNTHANFTHVKFGNDCENIHSKLSEICYYRKNFSEDCLKGWTRFSIGSASHMQLVLKGIQQPQNFGGEQV